jgi:L-2,4-diaminobutyrate decarboxylase
LFESEFLTSDKISKETYQALIARSATLLCEALPDQPYAGKNPTSLNQLIGEDFLAEQPSAPDQIARTLKTVVANSVAICDPNTTAHLHCPPLLASLAAEVVISGLNQSMDSFDQAPIATVVEQKIIRWLCNEVDFPGSADGTFTTGGSQSNYMGLLLARDAFIQKAWGRSVQKRACLRKLEGCEFCAPMWLTSRSSDQLPS